MKKVLGLDLGTTSIGWALVNQAENESEKSSIIKAGVRVNPLTVDEKGSFEQGKDITTNAGRRQKRSMRRNLKRYELRRDSLKNLLVELGWIPDKTSSLAEKGKGSTHETYRIRAKAATEKISLEELSKVLLMINKKRGYKSNRKTDTENEGTAIDNRDIAKILFERNMTPGEYGFELLNSGKKYVPEFYKSDLEKELDTVWNYQKEFYPEFLTDDFRKQIAGRGRNDISKLFLAKHGIYTADNKGKERKFQSFRWRKVALTEKLEKEVLAYVICDICGNIKNSSGYLGEISDRSKELYFNQKTVGQWLYENMCQDPHFSTRNIVFYRQDYIDEFNTIWNTQAKFHNELSEDLKRKIEKEIIFYQRRLKSQKGLINLCELENKEITLRINGCEKKVIRGPRVAPKASLVFQEFKMWQNINNILLVNKLDGEERSLDQEEKDKLALELRVKGKMPAKEALKVLFGKDSKYYETNYRDIQGNETFSAFVSLFLKAIGSIDDSEYDTKKLSADYIMDILNIKFKEFGFNQQLLNIDYLLPVKDFEQQPLFRLWHLVYSYEGDNSRTGDESLISKISEITGFPESLSRTVSGIKFTNDYGSLSLKAMMKILPYMMEGNMYDVACVYAGYNHSKRSLTKEQIENKQLIDKLDVLPKNSLRNPVVEKILNQMVNTVNTISENYGKPDEIHIEFARELKQNKQQRELAYSSNLEKEKKNAEYANILKERFGIKNVTKNDILRYKLYKELESNGYKALYSNKKIQEEEIFSNHIDIEHIIPQALLFDDSFSNKTLEFKDVNIAKGRRTARDFVEAEYGKDGLEQYERRVKDLYSSGKISKTKMNKLLMKQSDIPEDFVSRDLNDSRYIAVQAREMLESYVKTVVPTNGSITARLREDWQLVDVMKELNMPKYRAAGLTHIEERHGQRIEVIDEWTKRKDHRHHEMDALTIAFTKPSHIKYLNDLNQIVSGSESISSEEASAIIKNSKGKKILAPPMPLDELRTSFKQELESTLVSIKAKNKVVTKNINKSKKKNGYNQTVELTPRGQLHMETVYGKRSVYETYEEKVGGTLTKDKIAFVSNLKEREALLQRLAEFDGDPKKAFTGKNSVEKNPIWLDESHTGKIGIKVKCTKIQSAFAIRKEITPDLNVDKVMDRGCRKVLLDRLKEFDNDARKAFSNLDRNPIWLNKEKGIRLKRVTILENIPGVALHDKKDNNGNLILDSEGNSQGSDYVNLRNNHHIAIYKDAAGEYQEKVVTFLEALERITQGLKPVDRDYKKNEGWTFLFSMKINEMFVFPRKDKEGHTTFNPEDLDLTDKANYCKISPNLYRVQKLSPKDYCFRHHLETGIEDTKQLQGITWKRITSLSNLEGAVKVRINHIGEIVQVGEYD
ncbi:MAG: type II CRISPR RNA-guided endonuclease Cas9 [Bacteroidales bacterium]|nr:type II CRISPR RNA-guided endonuclease Cas9 [Bacteroidales bacterium]